MTSVPEFVYHPPDPAHFESAKFAFAGQRPSPAESSTAKAQSYLFINDNANSEFVSKNTVATSQRRSAIKSHAQRFRRRQNRKTLSASTFTAKGTSARRILPYRYVQQPSQRSKTKTNSPSTEGESSITSCRSRAAKLDNSASYAAVKDIAIKYGAPAIRSHNFLPGDACDPFNCTAVRMNRSNHDLVQFFLNVGWRAHLKIFGHTNTNQWSQSYTDLPAIIKGCLQHEMHMDAFLTVNATRMSFYKVAAFDRANSPEFLMVKSLRALRMSLSKSSIVGADERIVLDIFFLAFSEFYRQNYDVMRMHLKMIRRLVSSLGGFSSLCQYIREACCFTELCFAIETGQKPVFHMSWDPGPLHSMRWAQLKPVLELSKAKVRGIGFDDALSDGFFDISTTIIIEELLVDIQALEFIRKEVNPLPSDLQWACTRNRAYLHRLLSLPRPDKLSSLQQCRIYCVTTTLLIIFCYECTYVSALRSGKIVLARLKKFLHLGVSDFDDMEYSWGRQNDMLLWIMVVGACVAEGGGEEKWFLDRTIHGCETLDVDSHEGLCDLMSRFMGLGDLQVRSLGRLAGQIKK
jgi:hypothetical protein